MTYEIFAQEICLCSLWWNVFLLWKAINCWIRRSLFPIWHGNIWYFSIPKSMMVFIPNRKGQKVTSICYLQPINIKIICHCLSRSFFFGIEFYLTLLIAGFCVLSLWKDFTQFADFQLAVPFKGKAVKKYQR